MNGHEHYQRAEALIAQATAANTNTWGNAVCHVPSEEQERLTRLAGVHATLALAAATADATNFRRDLYRGNGEELPAPKSRTEATSARNAALAAAILD